MRKENGITLIALVITIIVLLILAGVTIASLSGENGILNQAKNASEKMKTAQVKEEIQLEVSNLASFSMGQTRIGLYSWQLSAIQYDDLALMQDVLGFNAIYQYMKQADINKDNEEFNALVSYCQSKNLKLYILSGDTTWYTDTTGTHAKEYSEKINEYNKTSSFKIKGFIGDIEYYTDSTWKSATTDSQKEVIITKYIATVKEYYAQFKKSGLEFSVCLSAYTYVFNDNLDYLEDVIANGCDSVEVMNYHKQGSLTNIEKYIILAKKHNKEVYTISEFLPAKGEEIPESITYYNEGILACVKQFNKISKTYNYDKLGYAYHHYVPLVSVFEKMNMMEPKYTYETTIKDSDNKYYEFENVYYKASDGTRVKASRQWSSEINAFVYKFYGLHYGMKYELVVANTSKYKGKDSTIEYQKSDGEYITGETFVEIVPTYTLEVYCKYNNSVKQMKTVKMKYGDVVITGRPVLVENSYYVYVLSNLAYNIDYVLEVEDDVYELEEEGKTYKFTDTSNNYYSISPVVIESTT